MATLDKDVITAIFAKPRIDGAFEDELAHAAKILSVRKDVLLLAFAPKSAGTYFRTAAINATGGQLTRIVHAEGGRDAVPYLPALIANYLDDQDSSPLITHLHMPASLANRHLLCAFDICPVIMLRSIPDMLASFWDMIEADPLSPMGLSFLIPEDFTAMDRTRKADLIVDIMGPWYAHYFASWARWVRDEPERVCVLTYDDFRARPGEILGEALNHAGLWRSTEDCEAAIAETWKERNAFRFHRGTSGRGDAYFTAEQLSRISCMLSYYAETDVWRAVLLGLKDVRCASAAA